MRKWWFAVAAVILIAGLSGWSEENSTLQFERVRIGGHDATFEAAAIFDVDGDGVKDLVSGKWWYPGPDFRDRVHIADIRHVDTYYDDFSNYPMDVNGDGRLDIVTGGWWGETLYWRENPGGRNPGWTTHTVVKVGNIERCLFYDLDGDGWPEVIPVTKPVHIFRLARDAQGKGTGRFEQFTVETDGGGGHGLGAGDISGDGRPDLIFASGWLEAPADTWDMKGWKWHPEWSFGLVSVPILTHDVNGDGLADLIVGEGHGYGLFWMEQRRDNSGARAWSRHDIETDRSQFHDLQLHDINNDGRVELVTGKRFWAHNGHDPGARDPIGLYYYTIDNGKFTRHVIDYGPPDRASGAGIYFWVDDVDGNGWKDILAPGKEGLYLFLNRGPAVP